MAAIDLTGYTCIIAPTCWSATGGNGTSDKYNGNFPVYPNGEACVLTSFNSAEGYKYSANAGYIQQNTHHGYILTPYDASPTNASTVTYEFWINVFTAANTFLYEAYNDATHCSYAYIGTTGRLVWYVGTTSYIIQQSTVGAETNGNLYHIVLIKNGTALSAYVNGAEITYTTKSTYAGGNITIAQKIGLLGNSGDNPNITQCYWAAINSAAFDSTRCAANYAAGTNGGGYIGTNTSDTMALALPSSGISIPVIYNSHKQHWN
jgi:hypothetical protein